MFTPQVLEQVSDGKLKFSVSHTEVQCQYPYETSVMGWTVKRCIHTSRERGYVLFQKKQEGKSFNRGPDLEIPQRES